MSNFYEVINPAGIAAIGLIQFDDVQTFSQLLQFDKISTVGILLVVVYWSHNQLAKLKEENKVLEKRNKEIEIELAVMKERYKQ